MEAPPGYPTIIPGGCWKLKKPIYGLKQVAWCWYACLQTELEKSSFHVTSSPCVFVTKGHIIASHVDAMISLAKDKSLHDLTKSDLSKSFKIHDLGDLSFYLGMKFTQDHMHCIIEIAQDHYIHNILEQHNLLNSCPFSVLMQVSLQLKKQSQLLDMATLCEYQQMIGSLMYAVTGTQPDLTFTACYLSQFANTPGSDHLDTMKYTFHYLAGTTNLVLMFNCSRPLDLIGYVNSDWASNPIDHHSITGYCFMIGRNPISSSSQKQPTITLSSTKGEYMATTKATHKAIQLQRLLSNLGFPRPH